jgi:hypothetical protein
MEIKTTKEIFEKPLHELWNKNNFQWNEKWVSLDSLEEYIKDKYDPYDSFRELREALRK